MDTKKYRYNHIGIPTKTPRPGETHLTEYKVYIQGYEKNDFNIEWMRYEDGCPLPKIITELPHVAFEVDNLAQVLMGKTILIEPNSPSPGVTVAFILENNAPVELMEFTQDENVQKK